jgi:transcriptional regulator of acetoin/glycerol metabolism
MTQLIFYSNNNILLPALKIFQKMGGDILDISEILSIIQKLDLRKFEFTGRTYKDFVEDIERETLKNVLCETNGNVSEAGRLLGLERTTLLMKARRLGVDIEEFRKSA